MQNHPLQAMFPVTVTSDPGVTGVFICQMLGSLPGWIADGDIVIGLVGLHCPQGDVQQASPPIPMAKHNTMNVIITSILHAELCIISSSFCQAKPLFLVNKNFYF
jgi:hypothetical protein